MTFWPKVAVAALIAALLVFGLWLWSRAGLMVWLQGAIATCF